MHFLSCLFISADDEHLHPRNEEAPEEVDEMPAWKKQALEKQKSDAGDPMTMNWNVDKMEG